MQHLEVSCTVRPI